MKFSIDFTPMIPQPLYWAAIAVAIALIKKGE